MAGTGTPPREKARVYRTGRPDRLCSLLFAVAALILCAGIGAVLWHEWQGTRPTAAEQAEADEIERADGGEEEIAAVTEDAADGKIVVAIDRDMAASTQASAARTRAASAAACARRTSR